mmetsp:Transcript_1921/g.6870  ORF Transcript_1921/g.6870 Transcript_1921/m.6870 type:complete len:281 (+) Transcript_1921:843-1685(+)
MGVGEDGGELHLAVAALVLRVVGRHRAPEVAQAVEAEPCRVHVVEEVGAFDLEEGSAGDDGQGGRAVLADAAGEVDEALGIAERPPHCVEGPLQLMVRLLGRARDAPHDISVRGGRALELVQLVGEHLVELFALPPLEQCHLRVVVLDVALAINTRDHEGVVGVGHEGEVNGETLSRGSKVVADDLDGWQLVPLLVCVGCQAGGGELLHELSACIESRDEEEELLLCVAVDQHRGALLPLRSQRWLRAPCQLEAHCRRQCGRLEVCHCPWPGPVERVVGV